MGWYALCAEITWWAIIHLDVGAWNKIGFLGGGFLSRPQILWLFFLKKMLSWMMPESSPTCSSFSFLLKMAQRNKNSAPQRLNLGREVIQEDYLKTIPPPPTSKQL